MRNGAFGNCHNRIKRLLGAAGSHAEQVVNISKLVNDRMQLLHPSNTTMQKFANAKRSLNHAHLNDS